MNTRIKSVLFAFVFIVCCPLAGNSKTITLVADEWPPFNNSDCADKKGYMIDVAREIFEAEGYEFIYRNIPWKRAVSDTRKGKYSGVVGASKTDARGFVFPDRELARNYLAFYVKKGSQWKYQNPASISSVAVAVIAGYDYRDWLNEYVREHACSPEKVQVCHGQNPMVKNLSKLMKGRVDVVVDNESTIRYVGRQMGILNQIELAGYGTEASDIYIAFSPAVPESGTYARLISRGIEQMRRSGRLKEILDSYGLFDWNRVQD